MSRSSDATGRSGAPPPRAARIFRGAEAEEPRLRTGRRLGALLEHVGEVVDSARPFEERLERGLRLLGPRTREEFSPRDNRRGGIVEVGRVEVRDALDRRLARRLLGLAFGEELEHAGQRAVLAAIA